MVDKNIFTEIPDDEISSRYKSIFCNPAGEFVLAHMAFAFGFDQPSYYAGDAPMDVATREGAKNVIRSIVERCKKDQIQLIESLPSRREKTCYSFIERIVKYVKAIFKS
jgi:hypothetical protein